jgi:AcrR family transcriptional regulator
MIVIADAQQEQFGSKFPLTFCLKGISWAEIDHWSVNDQYTQTDFLGLNMTTAERREREKRHRIELIMDAALRVFAEKGLKDATIDDVAEKAELSKGTIYLYFKSKEHLYFAIDMRAGQMLRERFEKSSNSANSGLEKVRAIGRAYYQFCFDYPNYFTAMLYVGSMDAATFRTVAEEMLPGGAKGYKETSLAVLAEAIKTGHNDGSIAEDFNPWVMSVLLWAISNGVIGMIKNRGDVLKLLGLPIDELYPAKELLVERGLPPRPEDSKKKSS